MILRDAYEIGRQQKLTWSCAVVVVLFLILVGHAPVLPVLAGGALTVGIAVIRTWLISSKVRRGE